MGSPTSLRPGEEPVWVQQDAIVALWRAQLRNNEQTACIRDENALGAALSAPRHAWAYEASDDVCTYAAIYAVRLNQNHPFSDGNKRVSLIALDLFLRLNGFELSATDAELEAQICAIASARDLGGSDVKQAEHALVGWLKERVRRVKTKKSEP